MKYTNLVIGILLLWSCSPEDVNVLDFSVKPEDITRIELRADHKTLIPNGIGKMEFYVKAYSTKDFRKYSDVEQEDTIYYDEETVTVGFEIPTDLLPQGYIKIYDENDKELPDNVFSTTQTGERKIRFYAKAGDLRSNDYEVTIRELPEESYEEIIYPVIFHVIIPPASSGPSYSLSTEFLQTKLDRVNDIFNRKVTTDPNGGNAKIIFKLAEYDENGLPLAEKGKEEIQLTTNLVEEDDYIDYIQRRLIWDPTKYLNIWVAKYDARVSETGSLTYNAPAPQFILRGSEPIPGIRTAEVDDFTADDVTDFSDAGFIINYHEFLNPNVAFNNSFEVGTAFASYLGLFNTRLAKNPTGPGYDNDYCPDTYYYYYDRYDVYKSTYWDEDQEDAIEYFTSFNVMDQTSRKNSISADQATRIRAVTDRCPSRWSYKSNWAFTGKD